MQRRRARRLWCSEQLESRLMLDAAVVFNEVMYNPAADGTPEWIELVNELSYDVDLSGWRIGGEVEYAIPDGTILLAGGYLVITANTAAMATAGYSGALGPWTGGLDNGGGNIRLRNINDRIMDEVDYGDDNRWPVGPDGSGATLAKLREQTASGTPENWGTSVQVGGTPGARNFPDTTSITVDTTLSPITATWKYHDAGVDLGTAWYGEGYDDSSWGSGAGLFFHEPDSLPAAKNTPLTPGRETYYFRSTFDFVGDLATSNLRLNAVVDDGAVYYLNGQEVLRQNMPAGPIAYGTAATAQVGNARFSGQLAIPPGVLRVGENTLAVEVHQAITERAYAQAVLNSEPVAYWKLDETSTAANAVGDSADAVGPPQGGTQAGSYSGLAALNLGQPGPRPSDMIGGQPLAAFATDNQAPNFQGNFDGGNDAVVFPDDGRLNFSAGKAFSLEAWINGAAVQEAGGAIFTKGAGGGGEQFAIDFAGNTLRFYVRDSGGAATVLQSTTAANGTWQHVAATFDATAGVMRLYVNGVQVGTMAPPATLLNSSHEVSVGARKNQNSSNYDLNFSGRIDEAAIYDRALSPAEVLAHYNAAFDGTAVPALDTSDAVFGVEVITAETLTDLTIETDSLFGLDTTWKYDDTGVDLGTTWRDAGYDDGLWQSGNALLYLEESALPGPKNTPLSPGRTTYYFRKSFEIMGDPRLVTGLRIRPMLDDGAVFYVNGQEVYRRNMPTGAISYGTLASTVVDNATLLEPISIPTSALVAGTNVLSVEVHQRAPEVTGTGTLPTVSSATLRLQLDTDALDVTKNATTNRVSRWFDRAGTVDDFQQLVTANQPLWVDGTLNGRPVLRFDGGDRLDAVGGGLNAADFAPFTFFIVTAGTTDPFAAFDSAPSQVNTFRFGAFGAPFSTPNNAVEIWDRSPALPMTVASAGSIVSARVSRTTGAARLLETHVIGQGATISNSGIGNNAAVLFASVDIGTINAGANGFFRGDIAEILLYSGNLSDTDRDAVEAYLKARYGLTGSPAEAEDIVFGTEMTYDHAVPLGASLPVSINEISAGTDPTFRVELANHGSQPIDLAGFRLTRDGQGLPQHHTFTSRILTPGELVSFDETVLNFGPSVGDRLFLYSPGGMSVVDAATVRDRGRGRSPDGTGPLLFTSAATFGSPNQFALHDEVVINEIMYHARPLAATAGTPGTYDTTTLLPMASIWRYNQNTSGVGLASGWAATAHSVDGAAWFSGPALLGVETAPLPPPGIQTQLTISAAQITYYFETEFEFNGDLEAVELQLRHIIDDGAVFYLNGQEVFTQNLSGAITPATVASPGVTDAGDSGFITIAKTALLLGTNRLSVEVHQSAPGSTDVVFGAEVAVRVTLTPPVPGLPFRESDEEWIELYNRGEGEVIVDLGGWALDDAVQYTFPTGTMLAPGEYAVVVRDAVDFAAAHPGVAFVGEYSGTLANDSERIVLRDAGGNPADEVRYFDGGRWSELTDGSGASLELRDPDADNSRGEAWADSDEAALAEWQTYTYRGPATNHIPGAPTLWQEFALGMLDGPAEMLIDDISVIEDPDGTAIQRIQNGTFTGGSSASWRILGNHRHSFVTTDPDNPANHVLHVVADGPTEYQGNQLETTFGSSALIVEGRTYEISFRARWVAGANLLNTRLYFNRLARTTALDTPDESGTPGAENSRHVANIGPTYDALSHSPVVPNAGQTVTVTVEADDPDGVDTMTLWYSANGAAWASTAMAAGPGGTYTGSIPGNSAGSVVQFYVEGDDFLGGSSFFPAGGAASRALYKVNDGQAVTGALHNFRIVMTQADADYMHTSHNTTSNERLGGTIIDQESEVYYDAGVRLKGSFVGRDVARVGFNIGFNPDQLFRGVHDKVAVDRSQTATAISPTEVILFHIGNHAGGTPDRYDDLIHVIAPRSAQTSVAHLRLSGFDDEYWESLTPGGGDGSVYEFEVIRWATQTIVPGNPEAVKASANAGNGYDNIDFQNVGDEKEDYRWWLLLTNHRTEDNYTDVIEMAKAMSLSGAALDEASQATMDVDQWMRVFALNTLGGVRDAYNWDNHHNLRVYTRPEDGKVLALPWDWDNLFNAATDPLVGGGNLAKIINLPANLRGFHGHLHDMISTTFNTAYMSRWTQHYGQVAGRDFSGVLSYIGARASRVTSLLPAQVPFVITTNGGSDFSVDTPTVTLEGNGWINVREIRLAGNTSPLDVTWTDGDSWRVTLPVDNGLNPIELEAVNFQGTEVATDSITVTSSFTAPNVIDHLRITELNYHPADPTDAEIMAGIGDSEEFEFVEFTNIGTGTLDLAAARIVEGIEFDFTGAEVTSLEPGEHLVIVENAVAFAMRYGNTVPIAGQYSGRLNNAGERLRLEDLAGTTILDFTYDDNGTGWYPETDGDGYTLVIVDPVAAPATWNTAAGWRSSREIGGSPGSPDRLAGDFDGNDRVDLADLAYLQSRLGATDATLVTGDLNWDGNVDRADAARLVARFGRDLNAAPSPPAASPMATSTGGANAPRLTARVIRRLAPGAVDVAVSADESPIEALEVKATIRRRR